MLHQVGVGALGPVFRTYEPTRDRLVAVKAFRLDITPEQAQTLADELSVAAEAGLFHPSIVEPIAAGLEGSVAYRAEEYVAAESLDVAMRHYAPASADKVLPFITQLAGAIDFARTASVGHGALHPRDVFVTPEEARATGFGVVEALERVGLRAPVRRPYSAPERVRGEAWGTPADVFSLAAIAYELLTGRRPAGTGGDIGALAGLRNPAHAAPLHAVLARAMDEDPARRFPAALAFAAALEAATRGEAAEASAVAVAPMPDPVDEDAAADVPPRAHLDERLEPVVAEQEEDAFRADEPEFDDIAAERDEDEAHAHLAKAEQAREEERLLFEPDEDEAVEDLALDAPRAEDTDRFADEFAVAARDDDFERAPGRADDDFEPSYEDTRHEESDQPPLYASGDTPSEDEEYAAVTPERRSRAAMLPFAITVVLALLVGFAAGHALGTRRGAAPADTEERSEASPSDQQPAPASGEGQAFSEQAVAPSEPPAPVSEAPAPSGTTAAEPPPAARTGRLVIRSTPSNAGVTLDGEWAGRTPLTLDEVPFGRHEVRVVQEGYRVAREAVTLSAASPSGSVTVRLQRNSTAGRSAPAPAPTPPATQPPDRPAAPRSFAGSIYVDSRPRGARVLLDGKMVGVTPLRLPDVPIGSHVIRLQLDGHRDWTTATRVAAGRESRVTGSLEQIR